MRVPEWRERYSILQTREMKAILGGLAVADVLLVFLLAACRRDPLADVLYSILLRNAYRSMELGQG